MVTRMIDAMLQAHAGNFKEVGCVPDARYLLMPRLRYPPLSARRSFSRLSFWNSAASALPPISGKR